MSRSILSEFLSDLFCPVRVMVWAVVSLLAGMTGPFGAYAAVSMPVRIANWAIIIGVAIALVVAARLLYLRLFPRLRYVWISVMVAMSVTLLLTPFVILLTSPAVSPGFDGYHMSWQMGFLIFPMVLGTDLLRHMVVSALRAEIERPVAGGGAPRLLDRLPEELQAPILHIRGRNHKVDVRTELGVYQVRLRLTDAIAETEGTEGLCPHRSHWVAVSAVTGKETEGNRPLLVLSDGTRVPVSRKYAPEVEARGLL